ncbi:hypothetical protein K9L97_03165 [Candidatus Woesearchaeota archaeon]|nr:hypothetical protein [Candidatus Woesearchaeota archaeon]
MELMKKAKIGIAGLVLALGLATTPLKAQSTTEIEGIKSFEAGKSYVRPTVGFELPGEIKGSSFLEIYGEKGYYGKTTLSKQVEGPISIIGQGVYGSGFDTRYGIGASVGGKITDGIYAKAHIIPLYVDDQGKVQDHKGVAGYYIGADLPLDMKISSFGEIRLDGGKGPEWAYGELSLSKELSDKLSVMYQPALKMHKQGDLKPKIEHRIAMKYKLWGKRNGYKRNRKNVHPSMPTKIR